MDIHHGYEPWKSAPTSVTKTTFGHADWDAAKSQGKSAKEIADWARANQQIMSQGPKNIPGGGGLWDQIMAAEQAARGGGRPSYAYTQSNQFIHDTYDPLLGYERPDSPGDNPYISNFTPKQFGYMNDPSTLTPEELEYRAGNIKGLDDRQNSIENAGALLNNYIFNIKEELNNTPKTKISTINKQQGSDDVRREVYDDYLQDTPSDRYNTSRYY